MSMPFDQVQRVNDPSLGALATELAKHIKSEQDIAALSRQLLKVTVESCPLHSTIKDFSLDKTSG